MSAVAFVGYAEVPEPMQRFGGRPYFDGHGWRCPDCNGFIALAKTWVSNRHGWEIHCEVCNRTGFMPGYQ